MPRVLIDGRAVHGALHGIARYTLALVEELARDQRLSLLVLAHPDAAKTIRRLGAEVIPEPCPFVAPQAPLVLARHERQLRPELWFCPSFVVPLAPRAPLVMTLHDATHLQFPEHYSPLVGLFYRSVTLPTARRAARVLTVSHHSARSLASLAGLTDVTVLPNGVDLQTFKPEGRLDSRLRQPSVLYAGGYKPHKRVELLLDTLESLPDVQLALAGSPPPAMLQRDSARALGQRLTVLGPLDDAELAAAYRSATVFAYPSEHEGFGLPPLEAMACGTPVLCADSSSLPEVVGEAALRFGGDAHTLRQALARMLDDAALRGNLRLAGMRRAATFTWASTAARLADILVEAAG